MNNKGETTVIVLSLLALLIGVGHYNYKNNGWGPQNTQPDICESCPKHGPISDRDKYDG